MSDSNLNRFSAGNLICSTRGSEIFTAEDSGDSSAKLVLVRSRFPVENVDQAALEDRLSTLSKLCSIVPEVVLSGVDIRSHLYVIFKTDCSRPLSSERGAAASADSTFSLLLGELEKIHSGNLFLGDLSPESFLQDNSGKIVLVGVLGIYEGLSSGTVSLPPKETLVYSEPFRANQPLGAKSDVYSLGAIAYRLFVGRLPVDKYKESSSFFESLPSPSESNSSAPPWLDEVLGVALSDVPGVRFKDASSFKEAKNKAESGGAVNSLGGIWAKASKELIKVETKSESLADKALKTGLSKEGSQKESRQSKRQESVVSKKSSSGIKKFALFFLLPGAITLGLAFLLFRDSLLSESNSGAGLVKVIADGSVPDELKPAISEIQASGIPISEKESSLARIAASKSLSVFRIFAGVMSQVKEPSLKTNAKSLMLEALTKRGYPRSSNVFSRWLAGVESVGKEARQFTVFPLIVDSLDPQRSEVERIASLREVVASNQSLGLQLSGSLALDNSESGVLLSEFRQLMASEVGVDDAEAKSIYELLFSDRKMLLLFESEIRESVQDFSHSELADGLKELAGSKSSLLKEMAQELLARDVVPTYQGVFLDLLANSDQLRLPGEVSKALVAGIRADIDRSSVSAFGRWYNLGAEKALLATCALKPDSEIGSFALKTLTGRTLRDKTAQKLVSWVKTNFWEYRKKLSQPIGILGLNDIATSEEIEFAINSLVPYTDGASIISLVKGTGDVKLLRVVVEGVGNSLSSGELLKLASNSDKRVRLSAIKALKGENDLHVLREILAAYKEETDPEVRALYEEIHWITRERDRDI